jgi:hypothetical protein
LLVETIRYENFLIMENLSTYSQDFTQQNFEFKDWELAFKVWYENYELHGNNIQFVVCSDGDGSGYWIEKKGTELGNNARVYTHKQVVSLKYRVKKEVMSAYENGTSCKFIS